ncbi:hypothetical protein NDU88_003216 [Pleurodeles waltl]|uniref:Uncharacterized protein n=1 Tax=Pleurodeles waltl TaxID=8319 RepID=A0AAV7MTY4_PLEWA|nr:hypothetical protein NDU88_003216 [Pleurodeles waltl]
MAEEKAQKDLMDSSLCNCACIFRFCMWMLGFSQILVGSLCMNFCPLQRFIPIYLITNGITLVSMLVISFLTILHSNKLFQTAFGLLAIFWFIWLITGSIWTFPHYHNYKGCNKEVYMFTFANLIIQWIMIIFTPRDII